MPEVTTEMTEVTTEMPEMPEVTTEMTEVTTEMASLPQSHDDPQAPTSSGPSSSAEPSALSGGGSLGAAPVAKRGSFVGKMWTSMTQGPQQVQACMLCMCMCMCVCM